MNQGTSGEDKPQDGEPHLDGLVSAVQAGAGESAALAPRPD
jgi:hypothetical protein